MKDNIYIEMLEELKHILSYYNWKYSVGTTNEFQFFLIQRIKNIVEKAEKNK